MVSVRRILELRTWPDLTVEAALRLGGSYQPLSQSQWPLPPGVRERVIVRWPRTYQWVHTHKWGDQILDMLRRRVNVVIADLPQPYKGTVQCEFQIDGRIYQVAFNISDYPDFVEDESTRKSLVTFKFQFREGGYADASIVPGGYLPSSAMLYPMLRYLRWATDHQTPLFEVYGRFSMDFSPGVRGEALQLLARSGAFRFHGGDRLVRYSRYLRDVARSRVCADLPGRGPVCFRFVEYLAMGSCIVGLSHGVRFPAPLVNGVHITCASEPEAIVSQCRTLLDDSVRRRAMMTAAREYFDRYLHRDQLSAYYLTTVLAAAGVS